MKELRDLESWMTKMNQVTAKPSLKIGLNLSMNCV